MDFLAIWLFFVACLRMLSVVLGYTDPGYFKGYVFALAPNQVTDVAGRLFAAWTLLTCTCCIFTAFNIKSKPIFSVTLFSFFVAFGVFMVEFFFFKTMTVSNLLPIFSVAGISIIWMILRFPREDKIGKRL